MFLQNTVQQALDMFVEKDKSNVQDIGMFLNYQNNERLNGISYERKHQSNTDFESITLVLGIPNDEPNTIEGNVVGLFTVFQSLFKGDRRIYSAFNQFNQRCVKARSQGKQSLLKKIHIQQWYVWLHWYDCGIMLVTFSDHNINIPKALQGLHQTVFNSFRR